MKLKDEYEEIAHPWKVDHPPCFILHLGYGEAEVMAALNLEFRLTLAYPESPPELRVLKKKGLQALQAAQIQEKLVERAKSLVGSEMIYELAEYAKDLLQLAAKKKVSFHDEMTLRKNNAEAETIKTLVKVNNNPPSSFDSPEAEEFVKKVQLELEIKERLVKAAREKKVPTSISNNASNRVLEFDPPMNIQLPDSERPLKISRVKIGGALLESELGGNTFQAVADESLDLLATAIRFEGAFYHTTHGRKKLLTVCKRVQELSSLRYSPLYCRVLGATLVETRGKTSSDLWIVTETQAGITLEKLLDCSGSFSLKKSMMYLEGILHALVDLHSCNISHQDLNLCNVIISTTMSRLQLINPVLTRLLRDLHQTHPISSRFLLSEEICWRPPEVLSNRGGQVGKKADIWCAAYIFLQMMFGAKFPTEFTGASEALEYSYRLPEPIKELLSRMIQRDPSARPAAAELLHHVAFSPKLMSDYEGYNAITAPCLSPTFRSFVSFAETPKRQLERQQEPSRYKSDFEEIQFLGRGAFGEVIKVQNRIDNRYYAIKRIRLDPSNVDYNNKILREVTTLSRLHHDRVVRYYQAWIEGGHSSLAAELQSDTTNDEKSESWSKDEYEDEDEETDEEWCREGVSSRKMYSSNMISSNLSLSSLIQFHTGFTSNESSSNPTSIPPKRQNDTVDNPDKASDSRKNGPQYLYIQMEYCPNQTLRDVIDAGVEVEECWRLFRQVVEGLCHVHSQGMIHRDLKPGNIFLDTNGDVKIGDFGLAVGDDGEPASRPNSVSKMDELGGGGDSLTGGIGTPLYVSPEQENAGGRYNQKVDMYSLGIILLELLVPFNTGMERAFVIKDARNSKINLPSMLEKPEMSKALLILKNLLNHDPKVRFSSEELLRSDLLPAKVEDEYISEAIRTVSSPNTPYFGKLLTSIFSQQPDPLKDYTFDYHSGVTSDMAALTKVDEISNILSIVFRKHGAIKFEPPLLIPKGIQNESQCPTFLSSTGQIVQLPSNFTRPLARFVAHNNISDLRRFHIGPVFRENPTGGQPRQLLEATFDMVYSSGDCLIPELEAIRVAGEAINSVIAGGGNLPFVLRINHYDVLSAVLTQSLVPTVKKKAVIETLGQNYNSSWVKVKNILSTQVVLPPSCIDSIGKLMGIKDLEPIMAVNRIEEVLRSIKETSQALRHLSLLVTSLPHLSLKFKICVDPLYTVGDGLYSGTMFQLSLEERKKTEVIAWGGSYKQLIDSYRLPTDRMRQVNAIGIVWQLGRLVNLRTMLGSRIKRDSSPVVLVYSSGPDMFNEKLSVVSSLWDAGIPVDIIREDTVTGDYINQIVRMRGIQATVHLKDHAARGQFGIVKLRNFEKRQETDLPRTELVEAIKVIINDPDKESVTNGRGEYDSSNTLLSSSSQPTFAPLNISLFAPYTKIKGGQKSLVMEKAVRAMAPVLASLSGPKPIEVIAHDVPRDLIRRIVDTLLDGEDAFKRAIEPRDDREAATKMRTLLRGLREKKSFAFLFNYREGSIDLVSLTSNPH